MLVMPFFGEFGWLILKHIRHVHKIKAARKIVCCQKGQEVLYPSATEFFTNWIDPVRDNTRCSTGLHWMDRRFLSTVNKIKESYPGVEIMDLNYDCPWHTSDSVKPVLRPQSYFSGIDVTCGVRRREFGADANWAHWPSVVAALRSLGLRVGLVGAKETSQSEIMCDAASWQHPDGETAGSVDLLQKCKLYVGSDTGVSHLAAMIDTPMVMFYFASRGRPDLTGIMQRATRGFYYRAPDAAWGRPDEILGAVVRCLSERNGS